VLPQERHNARRLRAEAVVNACSRERDVIDVYNKATNALIGSITEADLQVLVDALEEEASDDQDYYIDAATIDVIGDGRATEHLLQLLRTALGESEGVDIRWNRR
jgi:hypothetical protein